MLTVYPSQGLRPCGRAAFPSVLLRAVPLIHHIRADGLQRERNLHLEPYPLEIALPVRQPKGHGFTRALVCFGDMIRLEAQEDFNDPVARKIVRLRNSGTVVVPNSARCHY